MDRQTAEQFAKNLTQGVKTAAGGAVLFGLLQAIRMVLFSISIHKDLGNPLLYSSLIFGFFFFNGLSLISRSKVGYALIVIFAIFPLLGLITAPIHLLALAVSGKWSTHLAESGWSFVGFLQLIEMIWFFLNLFSIEVRQYVWENKG